MEKRGGKISRRGSGEGSGGRERAREGGWQKEGGRHPLILRTHAAGKRTRAYLPQRPIHIHDPGVHARAKSRANTARTHYATGVHRRRALSLLFNVVCTHIVRMHAINLYGEKKRERERERGARRMRGRSFCT